MNKFFQILSLLIFPCLIFAQTPNCLFFDGSGEQVSIPATVDQSLGNNNFTFEMWINGHEGDMPNHGALLSNRTSINSGFYIGIHDYWNGSEHKMLVMRYNSNNFLYINNGNFNGKILDGTCHHIAIVRQGTALRFYVDGNLIGSNTVASNINISTANPILVGNDLASNAPFKGHISDVRIWNVARTETELQQGIANGVSPSTTGLLGYWEMNESNGQSIADLTNQNNAVLGSSNSIETNDPSWTTDCCSASTNAIEEETSMNTFEYLKIYPNPGTGIFIVQFLDPNYVDTYAQYCIYSTFGKIVKKGQLQSSILDLNELAGGQYYIKFIIDEIETKNFKLCIIR